MIGARRKILTSEDECKIVFRNVKDVMMSIYNRFSKLTIQIGSQMKAASDTGNGQKQFMFVEPNTITYSRSKTSVLRPTTPPVATPPRKESISRLGGCTDLAITNVEQPGWNPEHLAGFDAEVVDFGAMLWDVDIYDTADTIHQLSPLHITVPCGNSGPLDGSSGSDEEIANNTSIPSSQLLTDKNRCSLTSGIGLSGKAHDEAFVDPCSTHVLPATSTGDTTLKDSPSNFVGYGALHLAARHGRLAILKLLVDKGQPVDQLSDNRQTALSLALEGDHIEVMRYLLEQGALPDALDSSGSTILHVAVKRGQCRAVELLLHYMKDLNVLDRNGCSALHVAVAEGKTDAVRLILERGADTQLKIAPVKA
jgi:hypothetical protein